MDVQNLLSHEPYPRRRSDLPTSDLQEAQRAHQYPTRHSVQTTPDFRDVQTYSNAQASPTYPALPLSHPSGQNQSPTKADPKNITFELLFDGDLRYRARLPMKVQIFPHDNTDGIVSTVKNFFGLYDEAIGGVSFEDFKGNTMIASYDNFQNGMAVFVRVLPGISQTWSGNQEGVETARTYPRSDGPHLDEGFQMLPPQSVPHQAQTISRPASRIAPRQSPSPQLNGFQRHPSIQKGRPRPPFKRDSRESSFQARLDELNSDSFKGNQSSDGDAASVTSSFRARNELVASAEISEANIVEGGRRQKAKFESSVRLLNFLSLLLLTVQPGTTIICAPSSARSPFCVLHISTEAFKRQRTCFSVRPSFAKRKLSDPKCDIPTIRTVRCSRTAQCPSSNSSAGSWSSLTGPCQSSHYASQPTWSHVFQKPRLWHPSHSRPYDR